MSDKYKRFYESGLFVRWARNKEWLRVSEANLFYCPNYYEALTLEFKRSNKWFILFSKGYSDLEKECAWKELTFDLTEPLAPHFKYIEAMSPDEGCFVDLETEQLIQLLPEPLRTKFLYNINLF